MRCHLCVIRSKLARYVAQQARPGCSASVMKERFDWAGCGGTTVYLTVNPASTGSATAVT